MKNRIRIERAIMNARLFGRPVEEIFELEEED